MKRFDLDQLVMLVLMLATVMAIGIGIYSEQDDHGTADASAEKAPALSEAAPAPAA